MIYRSPKDATLRAGIIDFCSQNSHLNYSKIWAYFYKVINFNQLPSPILVYKRMHKVHYLWFSFDLPRTLTLSHCNSNLHQLQHLVIIWWLWYYFRMANLYLFKERSWTIYPSSTADTWGCGDTHVENLETLFVWDHN